MTLILLSASPGEWRTALLDEDERLAAFHLERPGRPDGLGDLHRARVTALAPAMAGAFLAMAGGETGFLPESAVGAAKQPIARAISEGQYLAVRVTRAAQGGKGPRLTARLTPAEAARVAAAPAGGPALIARGPVAALRLARAHPEAMLRTDSAPLAARLRAALGPARVALSHAPVFDEAIEAELDLLAGPEVPLPGGGRLLIHPTPALTAIDVDAGSIAGTRDPEAQLRLNGAAVAEAARQIRLRSLAGAILLDVAGLTAKRRATLAGPLAAALAPDPLARLLGLGPLGLFEIQRQRIHPPLHELLGWPLSPLSQGLAALRRAAREAAARPGRRWALRAAPAVLTALADLPGALEEAAAALGTPLQLLVEPGRSGAEIEERPHG
ncbi:ribonuclease E/G [Roseicella frigidaeris]|uniref:Ribonuclease n=1 Tax=Roseicella frigidaeris TaxID=2230885 RepID=A0A327M2B7_9PROT|nr:ribonuclease E/G [Roseicella frigidaeris]RAI57431.1 ribonuclease [Roseicella frigidaeris]